jgi:endonuclease/exonuclease/phosphatase family metal-dependent hydrolase
MKIILFILLSFLIANSTQAIELRVASYNLQGWQDNSPERYKKINDFFKTKSVMINVSVLMVQESIGHKPKSTAAQLAAVMGWKSFTSERASDNEGLGFIYPKETKVEGIEVLKIKAKHSKTDYDRMALTMQIKHESLGKVRFINTHLAHQTHMGETRKKQIKEILAWVMSLEKKNPSTVIVFGGDFNADPAKSDYSGEFKTLTNSSFKFDYVESVGANFTWINKTDNSKRMLDHFFISSPRAPNVIHAQTQIYTEPTINNLSDHNLIRMNIQFEN